MFKKNADLIGWLGLTIMINFFPTTSPNPNGKWMLFNINSPNYEFNRYAIPIILLVVIIYRRWRNR